MLSLPLGGGFIKFATNNHRTASIQQDLGRDNMRLNRLFDAPQNTHSCIPVKDIPNVTSKIQWQAGQRTLSQLILKLISG